jgi:polyhydroxybutyrate depolymerase
MTPLRPSVLIGLVVAIGALAAGCSAGGMPGSAVSTPTAPPPAPTSSTTTPAATASASRDYAPGRHVVWYQVGGVQRAAVVVVPKALSRPVPLVFVFHGHGGSGPNIERKFDIEGLWPDAIVVYPDGLVGHKGVTDPAGVETGWQTKLGESGNRDIAFYDAMLGALRSNLPVDGDRIYLMGHSNGSAFVSLLLNQRGGAIAATANLSSQPSARLLDGDPVRSMFMSMGKSDPIVPFANQQRSIPLAEHKLGVDRNAATVNGDLRSEKGQGNIELETYIYAGGHEPPPEVPRLVVEFFRRHTLTRG